MSTGNIAILTLTVKAAGPIPAHRFITQAGEFPNYGSAVFGVTRHEALAAGDLVAVDVLGTTIVEADAGLVLDDALMVDAQGRVTVLTSGRNYSVGRAMAATVELGELIEVLLTPTSAPAVF